MKIVRFIDDIALTDREVHCPAGGFTSYRYLLAKDGLGFSLSKTIIPKGTPQFWHYNNHFEACYCISGHGKLENMITGKSYDITTDTVYALDNKEPHMFTALDETVLICIFNPPLVGQEVHNQDGSYSLEHSNV